MWITMLYDDKRSFDLSTGCPYDGSADTDTHTYTAQLAHGSGGYSQNACYLDLENIARQSRNYRLLSCLVLLLHLIGLMPFLEMSDKLSLVIRTIRTAMLACK